MMVMARSLALLGRAQSRASIFARDSSELGDVSSGTLPWLCKYRYRMYHHRYLLVPNRPAPTTRRPWQRTADAAPRQERDRGLLPRPHPRELQQLRAEAVRLLPVAHQRDRGVNLEAISFQPDGSCVRMCRPPPGLILGLTNVL